MSQTLIERNELFFGINGEPARYKDITITAGQGALVAGTLLVMVPSTRKYIKWDSVATIVRDSAGTGTTTLDMTPTAGLAVLLEAVDATSEASGVAGLTGGIDAADLVLAGSNITAINDFVVAVLKNNGIYVQNMSDSMTTG